MIETIKHLTGTCGEPHLNIFTGLTLILAFILTIRFYANKNRLD